MRHTRSGRVRGCRVWPRRPWAGRGRGLVNREIRGCAICDHVAYRVSFCFSHLGGRDTRGTGPVSLSTIPEMHSFIDPGCGPSCFNVQGMTLLSLVTADPGGRGVRESARGELFSDNTNVRL